MAWTGTPVAAASAIPMMDATGTTPVNTAANYRQGLLGALLAPAPGGPMSWRSGVLPTSLAAGATVNSDLAVSQTATASRSVLVAPGNCVVPRSGASGGPYTVTFPATSTVIADPASASNPRIDLVCVTLTDAAIGDTGTQGGALIIVNGTPASSPVAPAVPTGAIALAQLFRAASTDPVAAANITDVRKATSTYGGARALLPGDLATDAGAYIGELSFDAVTASHAGWRYWDGGAWRAFFAAMMSFFRTASNVNGTATATGNVFATPANSCAGTVVSTGTVAILWFAAALKPSVAGDHVRGSVAVSGATTISAATIEAQQGFVGNDNTQGVMACGFTAIPITPGANTYTMQYRNVSSATNQFALSNQSLMILAP